MSIFVATADPAVGETGADPRIPIHRGSHKPQPRPLIEHLRLQGTCAGMERDHRGTEGMAAWWKMPSAPGEGVATCTSGTRIPFPWNVVPDGAPAPAFGPSRLHQEVEIGDAPLDKRHPGWSKNLI